MTPARLADRRPLARWARTLVVLVASFTVTGCVSRDKSDLETYVAEVLQRPGGQIEPLPPIRPYERYLYRAAETGRRDPFIGFQGAVTTAKVEVSREQDAEQQRYTDEILAHNREELENFELDSLRMIGTLQDVDQMWAIIRDTQGTVHRVQIGNYLGRNYGKIIEILEDRLELREVVRDTNGRWEERPASLALNEDENP